MTLHGVDISSYQQGWSPTSGDQFAIVKASESTGYANPYRKAQVKAARDGGLVVGHYHFLHHGNIDAQVAKFVASAPYQPGDFLVCDWEQAQCRSTDKDAFIRAVKEHWPDAKVGLYCNASWWNNADTKYYGDFLWLAAYSSKMPGLTGAPPVTLWQYSDHPIDQNTAYFPTHAAMTLWAGATPVPVTKPVPVPAPALTVPKVGGRQKFRGGYVCGCLALMLPLVEADMLKQGLIKSNLDFFQYCYNGGAEAVAASAGTHDGGGVVDSAQWTAAQMAVWTEWGFGPNYRYPPLFGYHNHVWLRGCPHGSAGLNQQMKGAIAWKWNGLAGSASRADNAYVPQLTWQQAYVRHAGEFLDPAPSPTYGPQSSKEFLDVSDLTKFARTKHPQKIAAGKWAYLGHRDDHTDYVTLANGPGKFEIEVRVTLDKITREHPFYLRFVYQDTDSRGQAVGNPVWLTEDAIDLTVGKAHLNDNLGAPAKGNTRRLRVMAATWDPAGTTVTSIRTNVRKASL